MTYFQTYKGFALVGLLILASCANMVLPTPETARERYLVAEASYGAAQDTIVDLYTAQVITVKDVEDVYPHLLGARESLDFWYGRLDDERAMHIALEALDFLNTIVTQLRLERGGTSP